MNNFLPLGALARHRYETLRSPVFPAGAQQGHCVTQQLPRVSSLWKSHCSGYKVGGVIFLVSSVSFYLQGFFFKSCFLTNFMFSDISIEPYVFSEILQQFWADNCIDISCQ